ncbi:MAG: alpha/beta hydrolase [Cyanobacteriota bacterium]|nr:alpha/beta hydrolase [Cyanobacteriota bacterium]
MMMVRRLPGLLLLGLTLLTALPGAAAEKVVLKYSVLRESIAVAELSDLSRTGAVSPALESYLKLADKNPEDLRRWLNQSVAIHPSALSQLLNSFLGAYALSQIGEVIQTPSGRASSEALRGALITSAQGDNRVSLIEILENYPTAEVQVNGDKLMQLYQDFQALASRLPRLP